ncbi:MAG: hypothetical protein IPK32_02045 [Verrucomicrobiaceae bacterium]|nr:hypothetical protein [Verrucomicrobiaceae bacterium]
MPVPTKASKTTAKPSVRLLKPKPSRVRSWQWPLLLEIDRGFSAMWWKNYRSLVAKREAETIAPDELRELTALTDTLEEMNTRRVACFASASRSLGISLDELMTGMRLNPKPV